MSALQEQFSQDVALLLQKAKELGYGVTLGEAYRTPEQAELNAQHGTGIASSLHCARLAIDINLFSGNEYLTGSTGHDKLGAWWKTLSPAHRWGGDFHTSDYNHYSISPDGIRG